MPYFFGFATKYGILSETYFGVFSLLCVFFAPDWTQCADVNPNHRGVAAAITFCPLLYFEWKLVGAFFIN